MTPEQAQTLVGREFVHFKGKRYRLVAIAKHSETLEPIVVYRALYGEGGVWVRPFAMFFEDVDRDGYRGPRFRLAEDGADGAAEDAEAADASGPERTLPPPAGQSWFLVWVVVSIRPRSFWRRCLRLDAAEVWIDQRLVSAPDAALLQGRPGRGSGIAADRLELDGRGDRRERRRADGFDGIREPELLSGIGQDLRVSAPAGEQDDEQHDQQDDQHQTAAEKEQRAGGQ